MPRPRKFRKICEMPSYTDFAPMGDKVVEDEEWIVMSVDEFETVRLIDLEEMTQEECANQMNVARTTAQKIYNSARKKLALMLVSGGKLKIQGGDFELCSERMQGKRCGRCRRKHGMYEG